MGALSGPGASADYPVAFRGVWSEDLPVGAVIKPIKCGRCQQPMTVDEFFSDDHPCLTGENNRD